MSKKYFAKYLPDKNRIIQEGDLIEHPTTKNRMIATKDLGLGFLTVNTDWTSLKLFLCSRDIQWQDKFFFKDNPKEFTYNQTSDNVPYWVNCDGMLYAKEQCYKVIGEILIDGIKEGQEFTEKEAEYLTIGETNT